ncbi:hypothetical protein [Secundilactobacillus kimchicus]|uniref:hypothetical protein n=1 Tax=Secundilactobacillus kimchicus TaxID=528209 RepID=UPI00243635FD|nr:hypothetical protein [Secundilactobacillus kimchicus]
MGGFWRRYRYYFYFKNVSYQEVIYYARALHLDQAALEALVPDRKKNGRGAQPRAAQHV